MRIQNLNGPLIALPVGIFHELCSQTGPNGLAVYLALVASGSSGSAPSVREIALASGISPRTANAALNALEAAGFIRLSNETGADPVRTILPWSDLDVQILRTLPSELGTKSKKRCAKFAQIAKSEESRVSRESLDSRESKTLFPDDVQILRTLPSELGTKSKKRCAKFAQTEIEAAFESFKAAYPQRKGGYDWADAKKRFQRLILTVPLDDILRGARNYAGFVAQSGRWGTEFVKMPSTWLNRRGWEEEYDAPPDDEYEETKRRFESGLIDILGRPIGGSTR